MKDPLLIQTCYIYPVTQHLERTFLCGCACLQERMVEEFICNIKLNEYENTEAQNINKDFQKK